MDTSEINIKQRETFYNDNDYENSNDREKDKLLNTIERLSAELIKKRNDAVSARASSGIEQIWREDEMAFEGLDEASIRTRMIDYATETAPSRTSSKGPRRSHVYINIVRPKCETAEGRFSDIQLPTDDKNWGLKVTPVPEISKSIKDTRPAQIKGTNKPLVDNEGKPKTISNIAVSDMEVAKEKMSAMETEINDQLVECDYNGESRKVIRNAVRLGTGILKGPIVVKDLKQTWEARSDGETTVHVLKVNSDTKPASKSMSPWDVFPDPDCREDAKKAAYIWDRETVLPRELRNMIGVDGYLDDQIKLVLLEAPTRVTVATPKENQYLIRYNTVPIGNVYEKWEYNGDLDKDDLEALGCDCSEVYGTSVSACVIMCNDRPLKVVLNTQDTGELPYDFFQWTARASVPWGLGVAREMAWQQRIIVAAWRAMMDNAGDSSGANIVVSSEIEPMDGRWEITGKKLWRSISDDIDVRKAFGQFQISNNQDDLQRIIELALRFIDMETNLPMIFGGEKGELPETLGATNILVDSNNVALRARVKLYDDYITRPHINRYYNYNMQYNSKNEIKGDFRVDPRGTSILLERDQQAQSIEEITSMRSDPELKNMIDWEKAIRQLFSSKNLDILLSSEKIEENRQKLKEQPPPSDPGLEIAKIRADGEMAKATLVQKSDMAELQFKAQQATIDQKHEVQLKIMDREIKMMELSATSGIALDKIKANLSEVAAKLKTQVSLAKDKDTVPAEQVITPIAEPAGRATEGRAFQE